jgi:hypothetical protein
LHIGWRVIYRRIGKIKTMTKAKESSQPGYKIVTSDIGNLFVFESITGDSTFWDYNFTRNDNFKNSSGTYITNNLTGEVMAIVNGRFKDINNFNDFVKRVHADE